MNSLINSAIKRLQALAGYACIQRRQKIKISLSLLLAGWLLAGCFQHYYKTNTKEQVDICLMEKLKAANKYFIIHYNDKIMGTQGVRLENEQLQADLVALPKEHSYYTNPNANEPNVMKVKRQENTLLEVHVYTGETASSGQTHIALPLSDIKRIDVYQYDAEATRRNKIFSIVGVTFVGLAAILVIVLMTNPPLHFNL